MTTAEQRIKELSTRWTYVGESMTIKLNSVKGYLHYKVWAWIIKDGLHKYIVIKQGKYNGEDPDVLFQDALSDIGVKKIKLGVPQV